MPSSHPVISAWDCTKQLLGIAMWRGRVRVLKQVILRALGEYSETSSLWSCVSELVFVALLDLSEMIKQTAVHERCESNNHADTDDGHCGSSSILEDFFTAVRNLLIAFQ